MDTASGAMFSILWICLLGGRLSLVLAGNGEARLITHLMREREKQEEDALFMVRPVENSSNPLHITFSLALSQIVDLDEEKQALTVHWWEQVKWTDAFLRWNPDEYEGVDNIILPIDKLWVPDIIPYKTLEVHHTMEERDLRGSVHFDGTVHFIPQKMYDLACEMDITLFPFDQHECSILYGSWAYDVTKVNVTLDIKNDGLERSLFTNSQKWELIDTNIQMSNFPYEAPGNNSLTKTYQTFEFVFTVKRRVGFLTFVLLLPAILLYLMTLVQNVTFCLPPDHSDKIQIGLSIFLSYFVLLLIVVDSSPPIGTSVPVLGKFFSMSLILIALSVFLACVVFNVDHNTVTEKQFPSGLKRMVTRLAKLLFVVPRKAAPLTPTTRETCERIRNQNSGNKLDCLVGNKYKIDTDVTAMETTNKNDKLVMNETEANSDNSVDDTCYQESDERYWFLLACVLDRIFLISYILIKMLSLFIFLPWFYISD